MYKNFLNKFPLRVCAVMAGGALAFKVHNELNMKPHYAFNYSRRFYPASAEYPDIAKHKNIMARNLTKNLYAKLRDLRTPNGFTIDDAIQTGVDNPGRLSSTGVVAGDEETYKIFAPLFDKIIYDKHGFGNQEKHRSNLDVSKIKEAKFDADYVLSVRVRMIRNLRGFSLPSFCSRGERRDIEGFLVKTLYEMDNEFKGSYLALKDLSKDEEVALEQSELMMDRPYMPEELSANLGRDWPDARGIWLNDDRTLIAFVNQKDHVMLSTVQKTNDFKQIFEGFINFVQKFESKLKSNRLEVMRHERLGYLTTDPKNLGTAMKLSVRIRLPNLSKDSRLAAILKLLDLSQSYRILGETQHLSQTSLDDDARSSILEISSKNTLGKGEVEIAQEFVNSINKLIEIEKKVKNGLELDEILYKK